MCAKHLWSVWAGRAAALALGLAAVGAQAQSGEMLFVVSEGSSGGGAGVSHAQIAAKYQPVVEVVERVLGQPVRVQYVRDFRRLEEGMKRGEFDVVMARPSDYPGRALRDDGYTAVSAARPDGRCLLVVKADSPYKTLADLKGKRFIFPEQSAYMTRFCMAELRDQGMLPDAELVTYVREQGAIPFALKNGLTQVGGVASYSGVARQLDRQGLRVVHESRPQPFLPLITGKRIAAAKARQLGGELAALARTEQGRRALAPLGVVDFDTEPRQRLLDLLGWLDAPQGR